MAADSDRDELLMALFEAACALPEAERGEFLARASADEALVRDVRERLDWEQKMGGFLLEPLIARPDESFAPFTAGQILNDRFEILRHVAEGGMSVVYEALDRKQDQRIAIKCPKPPFQRRLTPEVKSALEVSHENICRVQAIHSALVNNQPIDFLTMEFLDGETLRQRLKRGALTEAEFLPVARQICAGLEAAHRKGVVHGDLKSGNVILTESAHGHIRAVITDFGLARRLAAPAESPEAGFAGEGTPDFAAPEIWKGEAPSVPSDIYAMGVILHHMLTGRLPSDAAAAGLLSKLPGRCRRTIQACMSEDPAKRPASADEIYRRLSERGPGSKAWLTVLVVGGIVLSGGLIEQSRNALKEPVRLAVMPFDAARGMETIGRGIAHDLSDKLGRLRALNSQFTSIPFREILDSGATHADTARAALGATHVLEVRLSETAKGVLARARVIELATGQPVSSLDAEYQMAEIGTLPSAITGAITSALHLNASQKKDQVNQAAYADYARGLAFLRDAPDSADLAVASFEAAARKDPASALPYASLAETFAVRFQRTELAEWRERAENSLHQAEMRNPDAVEVHLIAGWLHHTAGMNEQAVSEFTRALQIDPSNLDALRRMGAAYAAMNLPDEGTRAYQRAISMDPNYYRPHMDLGVFYYYRSEYEKAAGQFREVARLAPGLAQGHFNLGASYMGLCRFDESEEEYRKAISYRGSRNDLIGMGALRDYQHRFAEATMYYELARGKGPDSALLLSDLADSYRRMDRSRDALRTYSEALRLADENLVQNPRDAYTRSLVAYISARNGDAARADREIRQALGLDAANMEVRRWAVMTWAALGQVDRSMETLNGAPAALISLVAHHPDLGELQRDSRFTDLLSRLVH